MWGRFTRGRGFGDNGDLSGLRSFCACHTFLSGCLMFDHACCLPPVRQTERLAICCVSVPPWVVIAIRAFSDVAWLSGFVGSFRDCVFSGGDPDGIRKKRGDAENGVGGAAWVRFCVIILALRRFPRGVRWGYAPQTAPRRLVSLDSLHLIRGRMRFTRRGETRV